MPTHILRGVPLNRELRGPLRDDPIDELERIRNVLRNTRTDCLTGYTLAEVINIVRAVRATPWDIVPSDVPIGAFPHAARHGVLPQWAFERVKNKLEGNG